MSDIASGDPLGALPERAGAPAYLADLNAEQRTAVEVLDGPLLVLAGAGTGKTRVLTTRLAHLLFTGRARPHQVLAVTFTNRAAREMRERVENLVGVAVEGLWLGTFHALAARILRRHAELVGLRSDYTILDTDDQIRLLKQILQAAGIDAKRWPARGLAALIQRWKDKGLTPERVSASEAGEFAAGRAIELYRDYQDRLRTLNAADFGDLLLHNLSLFTAHPEIAERYQRLFRYILVDEYQDTNVAQYLWLRLLARGHRNICCVGDDDQSIYGWRGAEVGNILRFEKDFPGARIVRLERNYRSTPQILSAASRLIAHNRGRLGKTLWTEGPDGAPVRVHGLWDGEGEARLVGEEIENLQRAGTRLDEIAVLVRAGFQTREFEERFITLGIPYRVIGGPRFYEREEIRDAIAYLRLVRQPDDDLAFERIVNRPARGIGASTMRTLHEAARAAGCSLHRAACRLVAGDDLRPAARRAVGAFLDELDRWRRLAGTVPHTELADTVLDESGYAAMWQARLGKQPEAAGKLENLKELITAMEEFQTLAEFLEHVSLVMDSTEGAQGEMVNLMTLHSAKGLEFDVVFLPGWEEGLFPHQRALEEGGEAALEEERRLAYVGLTRARRRVVISFVANRRVHNTWQAAVPSRFVDELPGEEVEVVSEAGLYLGHGAGFGASGYAAPTSGGPHPGGAGWRRVRDRRGAAPVLEGSAESLAGNAGEGAGFVAGERCFHQKFGMGTVEAVEGDHLTIEFDRAGRKKVIAQFVTRI